jgi:hypothetical protein
LCIRLIVPPANIPRFPAARDAKEPGTGFTKAHVY